MVEVFAGAAVLCAVAKGAGLEASIAVDKVRKRTCRTSVVQLDLTLLHDQQLLETWLKSPQLLWVHLAPVCGTASRAREIRRFANDPKPLRSVLQPEGLDGLSNADQTRVDIANELFRYACRIFGLCCELGVCVTMENPKGSLFWLTVWVLQLLVTWKIYCGDFQACMMGSGRNKWTRIISNCKAIEAMNISCDGKHKHLPWGFAYDDDLRQVWATSLESQYPKKMCVVLTSLILNFAATKQLVLKPHYLEGALDHPLKQTQFSQVTAGRQPRAAKVPPLVPDFSSVATFVAADVQDLPCALMSKTPKAFVLHTKHEVQVEIPANSRLLRISARADLRDGGVCGGLQSNKKAKGEVPVADVLKYPLEVAFGLPWNWDSFTQRACQTGHPALKLAGVPEELKAAVDKHVEWTGEQLCNFRIAWCRKWLVRAKELDKQEEQQRALRAAHVASATADKRLLLTREILEDLGYNDVECLDLLSDGATLAGEVSVSAAFKQQFKPCLTTLDQLHALARTRNEMMLSQCVSTGSEDLDKQLLAETRAELEKGWAVGPFELDSLEYGATVSKRFALVQQNKVRLIDDFSISAVNDSCVSHNKIDLHMIDTFAAMVRMWFSESQGAGVSPELLAKTYDLKSAYRQIPIHPQHLKYSYFVVYNCELGKPQIYQLLTLPFGATHSVYCFLRLSRMLFTVATKGLYLLATNFYDDFILASPPPLSVSAKNSMELLFLLTGWTYARDGKKATIFESHCKALGVVFDFSKSSERILLVDNTSSRKAELVEQLDMACRSGRLTKQESLVLRGRLGFADSFVHGRLGVLILKQLNEHAYGKTAKMDEALLDSLQVMKDRLLSCSPRKVTACRSRQWFVYTDASCETEANTGGLGGVLIDESRDIVAWFGIPLDSHYCARMGGNRKGSLIYELELLAAVLALMLWCCEERGALYIWFGDNDAVRHSLIRATTAGPWSRLLMRVYLSFEGKCNTSTWFARVPTEANISDYPSRLQPHEKLLDSLEVSSQAAALLDSTLETTGNVD